MDQALHKADEKDRHFRQDEKDEKGRHLRTEKDRHFMVRSSQPRRFHPASIGITKGISGNGISTEILGVRTVCKHPRRSPDGNRSLAID